MGHLSNEQRDAAKDGTLNWRTCKFSLPSDERASCWWVLNPHGDEHEPTKFLNKCLALMIVESESLRVATQAKLRVTFVARQRHNRRILEDLARNFHWQQHIGDRTTTMNGVLTSVEITELQRWAQELHEEYQIRSSASQADPMPQGAPDEEFSVQRDDVLRAHAAAALRMKLQQLTPLGKEDIRSQAFPDTPRGAYDIMWENLELSLQRAVEAEARQMKRLEGCMQEMPN